MSTADKAFEEATKKFPGLIQSIYSKKSFLEFIEKWLNERNKVGAQFTFQAGKDMRVITNTVDSVNTIRYEYFKSEDASVMVADIELEYGVSYTANTLEMHIAITRGTYPLKTLTTTGSIPELNFNQEDLAWLGAPGEQFEFTLMNLYAISADSISAMVDGGFSDVNNNVSAIKVPISRITRHFWGVLESLSDAVEPAQNLDSALGECPSQVTVNFGSEGSYLVIVTTSDIEVSASGIKIGMTKTEGQMVSPLAGNLEYTKPYNIYRSTEKTTGTYTFDITKQ